MPVKPRSLSFLKRVEICDAIPAEDWDRFAGKGHLAIDAEKRRILDGDDNLRKLMDRVAESHSSTEFFFYPGTNPYKANERLR